MTAIKHGQRSPSGQLPLDYGAASLGGVYVRCPVGEACPFNPDGRTTIGYAHTVSEAYALARKHRHDGHNVNRYALAGKPRVDCPVKGCRWKGQPRSLGHAYALVAQHCQQAHADNCLPASPKPPRRPGDGPGRPGSPSRV